MAVEGLKSLVRADEHLAEHGGPPGIRDTALLDATLACPAHLQAYGEPAPDIASLAFGLARNHPFADGNKRTSYVVTRTFLVLNGHDIDASDQACLDAWLRLASGKLNEADFAAWLRENLTKL